MVELEKYIHQYLAGKLEGRALAIFESQMDSDPDFREKVEAARRWREEQLAKKASEQESGNWSSFREEHPTTQTQLPKSSFNRNALIFIGLVLVVMFVHNQFFRPKGNFEKAFQLPESIVRDLEFRYANDPDSVFALPETCRQSLAVADDFYKKKEFENALEPLEAMLDEEADPVCRSDAHFYTALIQLQLKDPGEAVQSLGQIEDFSRFGDDIQWYMALAFVQMAERNPDREKHAVRALEKIVDSAQSEERKEWAREVLKKYQ